MNDVNKQWNSCLNIIKDNVSPDQFNTWFVPIVPARFVNNELTLNVPSHFFVEIIEEHFVNLLKSSLRRVFGEQVQLYYNVNVTSDTPVDYAPDGRSAKLKSQVKSVLKNPFDVAPIDDIDPQLNLRYTFENYCSSASNQLAVTVGKAIADHLERKIYNPMFIFGSTGVGKTHLIQAIGIRVKEQNPQTRVLYVPARVFETQYTTAVQRNQVNDFINFYQSIDVLLIDDIHELAGKTGTQNTFFHIFNHLHQHNKQLVLTCDCRPVDLDGIVPRLISRFKWGMTVELAKPDLNLRRSVLQMRAAQDGLILDDDVVDFIAQHVTDSVRDLEGVVLSILAHSTLGSGEITLDLAQSIVSNLVKVIKPHLTLEIIAETVANYYNIDPELIYGKSRKREISDARQLVMYLAKNKTQMSSTNIGLRLSRNHATVLHACKQVEQRISLEKKFRAEVNSIEATLKAL
ncbi:MAG: chromosomal replication initiator protein DnaA [Muribaculaceae bacterium]|nr:chromosomal replication initiator protein DnaA [Muribaculaceae bacterium]